MMRFIVLGMLLVAGLCTAGEIENQKAELEAKAAKVLALTDVDRRKEVGVLFELGDVYLAEGASAKAMRMYSEGLRVDSLNFAYQIKYAELLLEAGRASDAAERLQVVYLYAEEAELIETARTLLVKAGAPVAEPARETSDCAKGPVVYLVPIGEKNTVLLEEVAAQLARALKLSVAVCDADAIDPGAFDRRPCESYLQDIAKKIQTALEPQAFRRRLQVCGISSLDGAGYDSLKVFVWSTLKDELPDEAFEEFTDLIDRLERRGQYNVHHLRKLLVQAHPSAGSKALYLGITPYDMYDEGTNFLFGSSSTGCAVMSYHRFSGAFNEAPQNRPRLVRRTLKQAISCTMFMMGIPRCSSPMCVRAYPNSLDEHDAKQDTLCRWCQEQLEKKHSGQ